MERALEFWETGELKVITRDDHFTESNVGHKTELYLGSIARLTDEAWDNIIYLATHYMKTLTQSTKRKRTSSRSSATDGEGYGHNEDERARMFDW